MRGRGRGRTVGGRPDTVRSERRACPSSPWRDRWRRRYHGDRVRLGRTTRRGRHVDGGPAHRRLRPRRGRDSAPRGRRRLHDRHRARDQRAGRQGPADGRRAGRGRSAGSAAVRSASDRSAAPRRPAHAYRPASGAGPVAPSPSGPSAAPRRPAHGRRPASGAGPVAPSASGPSAAPRRPAHAYRPATGRRRLRRHRTGRRRLDDPRTLTDRRAGQRRLRRHRTGDRDTRGAIRHARCGDPRPAVPRTATRRRRIHDSPSRDPRLAVLGTATRRRGIRDSPCGVRGGRAGVQRIRGECQQLGDRDRAVVARGAGGRGVGDVRDLARVRPRGNPGGLRLRWWTLRRA